MSNVAIKILIYFKMLIYFKIKWTKNKNTTNDKALKKDKDFLYHQITYLHNLNRFLKFSGSFKYTSGNRISDEIYCFLGDNFTFWLFFGGWFFLITFSWNFLYFSFEILMMNRKIGKTVFFPKAVLAILHVFLYFLLLSIWNVT